MREFPSDVDAKVAHYTGLPIVSEVLSRLEKELPSHFTYHSLAHSKDVIREAITYAAFDGLDEREIELLAIAAAYHDSGFLIGPDNHEERGAELARAAMAKTGDYTEAEIELVASLILETRIPVAESRYWTRPRNSLACYLLDADVSNLGRADFFEKTEALGEELNAEPYSFRRQALAFAEVHRWFTLAAKHLRQKTKAENLRILREELGETQRLDASRENLLEEVALLLTPASEFYEQIGTALEIIRKTLAANFVSLTLGNGKSAWLTFTSKVPDTHAIYEPGRRLFSDSRFATWIIEPGDEYDPRQKDIVTVPLPFFSLETDGYLQVIGPRGEHGFSQKEIPFLEECADLISLSLSSCYREVDQRRRASLRISNSFSSVSSLRQRIVLKPVLELFRWGSFGEFPRIPERLRELYEEMFFSHKPESISNGQSLSISEFVAELRGSIEKVCTEQAARMPTFQVDIDHDRELENSPTLGLGVVREILLDLVKNCSYGVADNVSVEVTPERVVFGASFCHQSADNVPHRTQRDSSESQQGLAGIFQEAKWLVFELPAVIDVTFSENLGAHFRITIHA